MKEFAIIRKWENGYSETKFVKAKSLKAAWIENVDKPLPTRRQNYKGADRSGTYYYSDWVLGVWTCVEEIKGGVL